MEQKKKPVKVKKNQKSRKFSAYAVILAALALAIAIPLNLLASRLDIVWDMTPSKMYGLTDTSVQYLKNLDKQVDFYFLMDMDVLSTDRNTMALYRCLTEYADFDNINFVDFEPDADPELTKQLQEEGYRLSRGDMVISCEGRSKHIQGNRMFSSSIATNDDGTQYQDASYFTGENYITGAIESVVSGRDTAIYFLSGHGEKTLENDYTKLTENLTNRNYAAHTLNLSMEDAVPEDAAMLILAAPKSDISNDELRKLNAYLDQGGNICFWMSPNEEELRYKNIDSLLEDFGLAMDYDIVAETNSSLHISGDPYTFRCNVVASEDELDLTSEIIAAVNEGVVPFMSNTRSFYAYYVGSGTDTSVKTGSLLQTIASTDALGNETSSAVGELCGNTDPSATDITDQVLDLAMYSTSTMRNDAKIMVMGNAEFIDDTNVTQDYMMIPVDLMLSVFSWMYDSDLALDMGITDKEQGYDTLLLNSESAANTTNIIFIAVPFAVALVGAGVWLKRRYS